VGQAHQVNQVDGLHDPVALD